MFTGCTITVKNATKLIEDLPIFQVKEEFNIFNPPSMNVWAKAFNEVDSPILLDCFLECVASSAFDFDLDTLVKFVDNQTNDFNFFFGTPTRTDYDEINILLETVLQTHFEAFEYPGFDADEKKYLTIAFQSERRYYWLKCNVVHSNSLLMSTE
uniref:GPN-loop GTPase 2 n=1 Tax=Panagrellus redivivus TaxID=6233 RepID=A0A7E4UW85_PANRE